MNCGQGRFTAQGAGSSPCAGGLDQTWRQPAQVSGSREIESAPGNQRCLTRPAQTGDEGRDRER